MLPQPTRRTALRGLAVAAGATVVGFDTAARAWATDTATGAGPFAQVPPLDGTLLTDDAAREADADDYGHIVHRKPAAVLRPGSVDDVVAMVRFCRAHGIDVAPRGQGHGTFGQAQTAGGLVVETGPLDGIGPVCDDTVTVGAGARWSSVVQATLPQGMTPPVFTDYLELSVGGTLSVGGLGGQSHQHGAQVDTVAELHVVTGAGESVRCSAHRHRDLFDAVRAGLGQCAIVVGATLRLVRAPQTVRHYLLPYHDLDTFLTDQRRLVTERRFAYVEGQVTADDSGAYTGYVLEAAAYGPPAGPEPDDAALLAGLGYDPSGMTVEDLGYHDFLNRLAAGVEQLKQAGLWDYAHPWLNVLLPGDRAAELATSVLSGLGPEDVGPGGVVLLYPLCREQLQAPLLRMPDDPLPYLLSVLRTCPPGDQATVDRLLAANRRVYETVRDHGGKQYPVGSIPFDHDDWRDHFGTAFPALRDARHRYDPADNLTPGQGVF
jgi:FAD/FMN-containing dehydrogenase